MESWLSFKSIGERMQDIVDRLQVCDEKIQHLLVRL